MGRLAVQRWILVSFVVGALATAAVPAAAGAKKPFSGKICGIPSGAELSAAHISDPCVQFKTSKRAPKRGSLGAITYSARWGPTSGVGGEVHHFLTVSITKAIGSGPAFDLVRKRLFSKILEHGFPVPVGSRGSVNAEESACPNPPTNDCYTADVLAMKGSYAIHVTLGDAPPTNRAVEPSPAQAREEDEQEDNEFEDTLKAPVTAIAQAIAAKL